MKGFLSCLARLGTRGAQPLRILTNAGMLVVVILASSPARGDDSTAPHVSTAFYYGPRLPSELLAHFDRVVVESDNLATLPQAGRQKLLAYVGVGEVNPTRPWRSRIPRSLILSHNPVWNSDVVDTRSVGWSRFLLDEVIEPILSRGFSGVFLDALDSYERVTRDPVDRERHARNIAALIEAIRARHPELLIVLNRGFAALPFLSRAPDGLVAESLFQTGDARGTTYSAVPAAETAGLLAALSAARARWNVPITVIDYVAPVERDLRRKTALRIWNAGFDPFVTTPSLDSVGVGRSEIIPRRVLLLYKNHPEEGYLGLQDACVLVAPILEWMGYAVDYVDVRGPLPDEGVIGRYAGVVSLVPDGVDRVEEYRNWILRLIDQGVRFAFLESFGFAPDGAFLARLGLRAAPLSAKAPVTILSTSPYVGFEGPVNARSRDLPPVQRAGQRVKSLLTIGDADGASWDAVVIGPWGGAAFSPYVVEDDLQQERHWTLDPFTFIRDALALENIPAPDVTTESGRRILTVHIDGDAFVSRAERPGSPYAGQVVLDEILKRYSIPQTVSVVEGEIGPAGLYASQSEELETIARKIFRLPYVEIGSHTFSHPFDWANAEAGKVTSPPASLPIPNYVFSMVRDLRGSIEYINERLAPPGKSVKVLQWSGDCSPSPSVVAYAQTLGVENVNGGGSTRTNAFPSMTRASAMGIPRGQGTYQVFAPIENENVYTNDWHGPFYGYENVLETFDLNEAPRRLSPISIYYHFYSGVKTASLAVIRRIYDWALQKETTRLYLSEYAAKVRAFQDVSLARRVDDGAWEIAGLGELRTLRVDPAWGVPDFAQSTGVAGFRDGPSGRYVHLARDAMPIIYASGDAPSGPYIDNANGRILSWKALGSGAKLRMVAHEPLVFTVRGARACTLKMAARTVPGVASPQGLVFQLADHDTGEAELECR